MKVCKYYCDRCKKEADYLYTVEYTHWFRLDWLRVSLCKSCFKEVKKYMRNDNETKKK